MTDRSEIPICILAGGTSRRFGSDKAIAKLDGKPLVEHVLDRLRLQSKGEIAINARVPGPFLKLGCPILDDRKWADAGPLAGVYSAMSWAGDNGQSAIITVAVDQPFLPLDLVSIFAATLAPSIASSNARAHPINGIWNVSDLTRLDAYLMSGKRSAYGWAEECGSSVTEFSLLGGEIDPFWNVNTREDMMSAEAFIAAGMTAHDTE